MDALHTRISYASWRLRVFQQLFLAPSTPLHSRYIHSRSLRPKSSDDHTAEDLPPDDAAVITTNETKQENDFIIPPSQLLPQSPLITNPHPERARHHRKKRAPTTADLTPLRQNPWAMALASPVRLCTLTGARAPKAFLTDWAMVEAAAPPPNPSSTTSSSTTNTNNNKNTNARTNSEDEKKLWLLPTGLLQEDDLSMPLPQQQKNKRKVSHLKMRMIDRLPILRTLTEELDRTRGRKKSPVTRLVPFRWKHPNGPVTAKEEARLVWRGDMPEFVLSSMRREAMRKLFAVSDRFRKQDVANGVWTSIPVSPSRDPTASPHSETDALMGGLHEMESCERMGSGVILVLGDDQAPSALERAGEEGGLSDFVTLPLVHTNVPLFDFRKMFSSSELQEIRAHHERFRAFALFLRPTADHITIEAVLALWKLQGFLRE